MPMGRSGTLGVDYPFNFYWVNCQNPGQKISNEKINTEKKKITSGKLTEEDFEAKYRKESEALVANGKLLTKIWNASRLIYQQTADLQIKKLDLSEETLNPIESYLAARLNETMKTMFDAWDNHCGVMVLFHSVLFSGEPSVMIFWKPLNFALWRMISKKEHMRLKLH